MVLVSGSENTFATRAGASASRANRSGSGDQGTMSIRSPPSSFTTACTREPLRPTQAPTGSMASSREMTATLVRLPDLARDGADLDDLLLDLGHLELEQRLHEQRIAPGEDQPRALGRLLQPLEHGADRVALVEMLAVVLLAVGDDRLGLAELVQHDDELAALDLLDLAGQQLAHLVGELLADPGPLALAHPLDDPLLGGLHREPAEFGEGNLFLEHVADLEVGVLVAGPLPARSAQLGILDRLDHLAEPHDPDGALQLVDARARTCTFGPNLRTSAA